VLHGGPALAKSPDSADHTPTVVDLYRRACVSLAIVSILVAATLTMSTKTRFDPDGIPPLAWLVAALLVASRLWWGEGSHHRVADFFGTLGVAWLASASCGSIAMLGLRLHRPLADDLFRTADVALHVDVATIVAWLVGQGQWIFSIMSVAYAYTIPVLMLSMAALALSGKRVEAWRAAFCFTGTLLTIVLLAMLMPAKGMGLWTPQELLARLPTDAMRYFWPKFDAFYSGQDPLLRLDAIDGVVSFPSFHAAMGFTTVAMWRHNRVAFSIAVIWLTFMLLATFPYGGHYVVDIFGGLAVWAAWFALSLKVDRATSARPNPSTWSSPSGAGSTDRATAKNI
jgi:hypothetical protein